MSILWYRLMEPLIATARRVLWLSWLFIVAGLILLLSAVDERSAGVARHYRRGGLTTEIERAKDPSGFDRLVLYHALYGFGLMICGALMQAVLSSQDKYDLLSPDKKFKSLGD
jgi:hypothetical protein